MKSRVGDIGVWRKVRKKNWREEWNYLSNIPNTKTIWTKGLMRFYFWYLTYWFIHYSIQYQNASSSSLLLGQKSQIIYIFRIETNRVFLCNHWTEKQLNCHSHQKEEGKTQNFKNCRDFPEFLINFYVYISVTSWRIRYT